MTRKSIFESFLLMIRLSNFVSISAMLYSLSVSFFQKLSFHKMMDSLQRRNIFYAEAGCLCNNINSNAEPLEITDISYSAFICA